MDILDSALTPNGWIVVESNALGTALAIQGQYKVRQKEELLILIVEGR
jgi:hypothetical protein